MVIISTKAGDEGRLFGSIGIMDIVEAAGTRIAAPALTNYYSRDAQHNSQPWQPARPESPERKSGAA